MESLPTTVDSSQRLAGQLQALSEIAEALTYRLLTVEERLAGLDRQLQQVLSPMRADDSSLGGEAAQRLDETEERLTRLEALLAAGDAASSPVDAQPSQEPIGEDAVFLEEHQADELIEDGNESLAEEPTFEPVSFAEEASDAAEPLFLEEPLFLDEQDQSYGESESEHQQAA